MAGDTLVSNFNAISNLQGTGTSIVQISPGGQQTLFSQIDPHFLPGPCPGGVGLTTALTVLGNGDVVVGRRPGQPPARAPRRGCLIVLDRFGQPIEPGRVTASTTMDLASAQYGDIDQLFVTNVLNGTVAANGNEVHGGTVVRLDVKTSTASPGPPQRHHHRDGVRRGLDFVHAGPRPDR